MSGLMCELLWSDPQPLPGRGPSKRGVGLSFGGDVTKKFLQENNLGIIYRASVFCFPCLRVSYLLSLSNLSCHFSDLTANLLNRFSCAIT